MALNKEEKKQIIKEFGKDEKDSGSTEVQIAILTKDINKLNRHFKDHKHDFHSNRGLLKKVGKRRRLLSYYKKTNPENYNDLIKKLGLRK